MSPVQAGGAGDSEASSEVALPGLARPLRFLCSPKGPVYWIGANFWSRGGGPLMWRQYDPELVGQELRVLKEHGLAMTRSFFYWPDTVPQPHVLDADVVERFAGFLDLHAELGMATVPTFVVGHMSGQNWDPSWRAGRDLYRDIELVAEQAWYIRTLVERFAGHEAVAGWLVSNEMPIYGSSAPEPVVTAWAEVMVQAVRAGGGAQPVSIGDGAWGIEVTGQDNGFSVRRLGELTDFVGPHVYRMERDRIRSHLKAAFICELAAVAGKPVVLEEFGLSSDFASEENAAHYYRQVLHSTLLAGATGWIGWNNTDFDDLAHQDPYRHHPFELHFGLTTAEGRPKAQLREMADFATILDAVDVRECERWLAQTALVVPSYLETALPLTAEETERTYVFACLEQAYLAAREADVQLAVTREVDGISPGARLYLVPSVKALTAPGWLALADLARAGATVYVSYGLGESDAQRGPWWTGTEELFGVRHRLAYGISEAIEDDVVTWTFEQPFGGIEAGEALRFVAAGGPNARTYLPVDLVSAEVVARDARGRVALCRNRIGDGVAVLSTYPTEYFAAAAVGAVNPEDTWRLYDALATEAGVVRPVQVADPRVLVDGLVRRDGRLLAWLLSQSEEPVRVSVETANGAPVHSLGAHPPVEGEAEREAVDKLTIPPFGAVVVQVGTDPEAGEDNAQ